MRYTKGITKFPIALALLTSTILQIYTNSTNLRVQVNYGTVIVVMRLFQMSANITGRKAIVAK